MEKNKNQFLTDNIQDFKTQMLHWASRFSIFCFLDSSSYEDKYHAVDCLLAAGDKRSITLQGKDAFASLQSFHDVQPGWLFGHLGFELTSEKESDDNGNFAPGFFFEPEILIQVSDKIVTIEINGIEESPADIFKAISSSITTTNKRSLPVTIKSRLTKEKYIDVVEKIKVHIRRGDCYELNFCQEFFSDSASIDPLAVFASLQEVSPNPFTAFYRVHNNYCVCASPERFIRKHGQELISQPIKGTAARSTDSNVDEENKKILRSSAKEKSENVMIVDLVRNDFSKVCEEGSVYVAEMFGIYTFPQVHQMISTIKGSLAEGTDFTKAIEATFPMGSMTGAPKKKVLELIKKYEHSTRGLFSGSIGYIDPQANFDFNVVIRSIFYNDVSKYLSYWAGGGITFYSDPNAEYEECMAKVEAIKKALC